MTRRRIATLTAAAALALTAIAATGAGASYHENMVREVHQGTGGTGTGDFVELQAFTAGQNFVAGRYVRTYDGAGIAFSTVLFPANLANGSNQASILVANDASVAGADVIAPLNVINTGGSVCFVDTVLTTGLDCVSWRGMMAVTPAAASPSSPPLQLAAGGLADGQSIERSIARGCATALDPADDTNSSAADFALATPSPRGNAAAPTGTSCAPPCRGQTATIFGTEGADILEGTNGADVITGLGGKDKLKGLGGKDLLCGGAARDILLGGAGKDTLLGEAGKDVLKGGAGKDKLIGGPGKDKQTP